MFMKIIIITISLIVSSTAGAGVREDWQAVADAVASSGDEFAATKIEESVNALSDEQLEQYYGKVDFGLLIKKFKRTAKALDATDQAFSNKDFSVKKLIKRRSAGFPDAMGYPTAPLCPFSPDRSNADDLLIAVDAIKASRESLEAAQIIWTGLSRACDETIVILGEGGNAALACIPVDIVLFAAELVVGTAEAVVEHIGFCDAAVDSAEIEGSYERTGHIHSDLNAHDTEIKAQVSTHDTEIKAQVLTHDTDIKHQLLTHDTDIKLLLAGIKAVVDANGVKLDTVLARQLEVIRLLHTPQGKRSTNVPACSGGSCKWNNK